MLTEISKRGKEVILLGDFNVDLLKVSEHKRTRPNSFYKLCLHFLVGNNPTIGVSEIPVTKYFEVKTSNNRQMIRDIRSNDYNESINLGHAFGNKLSIKVEE